MQENQAPSEIGCTVWGPIYKTVAVIGKEKKINYEN